MIFDLLQAQVAELEGGVAQPEAEGEGRLGAVALQLAVAVPQVVGDLGGVAVKEGQVFRAGREDAGQPPAGVGPPEQQIGQGASAFHAGVPQHQNRRHLLAPGLGDHRAAGHDGHHRARVGRRHGLDQGLILGMQAQRNPVAARREALLQPCFWFSLCFIIA